MSSGWKQIGEVTPSIVARVIQTRHKGVLYRSRTEARWAVFFDMLGVAAQFEPETFEIEGQWYLPDFFVPEWQIFIEVKGLGPSAAELRKARLLAEATGFPVFIAIGDPGSRRGRMVYSNDPVAIAEEDDNARITGCRRCPGYGIVLEYLNGDAMGFHLLGRHDNPDRCSDKVDGNDFNERWTAAVAAARDERFGVHPNKDAAE